MNVCIIFIKSLQTHGTEVILCSWKNNLCHPASPPPHPPVTRQILEAAKDLRRAHFLSKHALDLVTQMHGVDGALGFIILSSNSKSGWCVAAEAKRRRSVNRAVECYWHRCCGHWQIAGTLPQVLATRSAGSQNSVPPSANSALPAARFLLLRCGSELWGRSIFL